MILVGKAIAEAFESGAIVCQNYSYADFIQQGLVNPNSIDLTLGNLFYVWDKEKKEYLESITTDDHVTVLHPGECALAVTQQFIGTSAQKYKDRYVVPCIEGKSTMARNFLAVHVTAGFGDIGYTGAWTLELVNLSNDDIYLTSGMRICQIYFHLAEGELLETYANGSYNNTLKTLTAEKVLPKKVLYRQKDKEILHAPVREHKRGKKAN